MGYRIAVLPGDGVGPEVVAEGLKVLEAVRQIDPEIAWEWHEFPWGCGYYKRTGRALPEGGLHDLAEFDAIFFGAVGDPDVPDHIAPWQLLLPLRQTFQQYVNLRPVRLLPGVRTPLAGRSEADIDLVFVRENSEGAYVGHGGRLFSGTPEELATQTMIASRRGTERILRYAFDLARRLGQPLTSVHKRNALNHVGVYWEEILNEVAADYPDVTLRSLLVDAAAMFLVQDPGRFKVVVTDNLFGDILTDLGAAVAGGLGLAASGNINPERQFPSMFEPIHGSAPDIAGRGRVNPLAAIWAAGMLLEHLGREQAAAAVYRAVETVTGTGAVRTADLGGGATTREMGDEVVKVLRSEGHASSRAVS